MGNISNRLLDWYKKHKRQLPWRNNAHPYTVWISEVMLQQTRVETVQPYFERWLKHFPTVRDLANASEQQVLKVWEGLGYYSRARNLHRAAIIVIQEHGGELPREVNTLLNLPGIGKYTVAAIASIAFGYNVVALDGNLRRVFARLFDVHEPVSTAAGGKYVLALAEANLPKGQAGDYNQALMDLGAMVCLPRNPTCQLCPLSDSCQARILGVQEKRPVKIPRQNLPHRNQVAAVVIKNKLVLLARRPSLGLLGGMWEFPTIGVNGNSEKTLTAFIQSTYGLKVQIQEKLGEFRHAYTHFHLHEYVYKCKLARITNNPNADWIPIKRLNDLPMGKVDRQIANHLL